MKRVFILLSVLVSFFLFSSCEKGNIPTKKIIGETAVIDIGDSNFSCMARVDTGATSTSIHAFNIVIENGVEEHKQNIGKKITFDTMNDLEIKKTITAIIDDVDIIKNSQGKEKRYSIKMKLGWHGFYKDVAVNLRDRSKMEYKVLIGRRFLKDDFLVDVSLSEDTRK